MHVQQHELLYGLKVLADESRLLLLRLLKERQYTVGELAKEIGLTEPTVSHHLSRLHTAGFLTLRMAGNQRFYSVNEEGIARFKRRFADFDNIPLEPEEDISDNSWIEALDWSDEDKKVLREHTTNGTLIRIPAKQKKWLVVLRWIATKFQPETMYSELEVNDILKSVYKEDHVSLRRDLVDMGFMRRERGGGKYWLAPEGEQLNYHQQSDAS